MNQNGGANNMTSQEFGNLTLEDFFKASGFTPMRTGAAKKSLSMKIRYDGVVMTKENYIRTLVKERRTTEVVQVNKIKDMSRMAFFRANNCEQAAHEQKIRDAGKKSTYCLVCTDNTDEFSVVSKTEFDFFEFLTAI
jgi:hypothetical protein